MEAACRGAKAAGGLTIGILPGTTRDDANAFVDVALPTGLGEGRNVLVTRAGEAVIAIGGAYGTLAEIGLALKAGTPVVGLDTWELARGGRTVDSIERVGSAAEAVARALELARSGRAARLALEGSAEREAGMARAMSNGQTRRRVVVSGGVQGVNFRDAARREAESAGVAGWVTNRDDGSVEAAFEGDSDAVERMVDWCRSGPGSADVEDVDVTEEEPQGESSFEVR